MPVYTYKCKSCEQQFDTFHDMSTRLTDCEKCGTIDSLKKVLSSSITVAQKNNSGQLVRTFIEENKESLKEDMKNIKRQDYNK
jgi:putative FmdB family regulatory protein